MLNQQPLELDEYEKAKLVKYLKSNGNIVLGDRINIVNPVLTQYVINIFIITYNNTINDNVNNEINNVISDYFLNLNVYNRIPKSDLISLISELQSIHSVDISFISKANEDFHRVNKEEFDNRIKKP